LEKALHSGPVSSILSVTTKPQLPQNISPVELSVTIGPLPHRGHRSPNMEISFTNIYHHKTYKVIPHVFISFLTYKYIGNYLDLEVNTLLWFFFSSPLWRIFCSHFSLNCKHEFFLHFYCS
jgi:hypothetical protein